MALRHACLVGLGKQKPLCPMDLNGIKTVIQKEKMKKAIQRAKSFLLKHSLLIAIAILCIIIRYFSPGFFSWIALSSFLHLSAIIGLLTLSQAVVILTRGIDLSNGALVGLTSILCGWILLTHGLLFSLAVSFSLCIFLGCMSGLFVSKAKVPPLIATLAIMGVSEGLALFVTYGRPVAIRNEAFRWLGSSDVIKGIPICGVVWLSLAVALYFLLVKTIFGRHIYAVGGSEEFAYRCGINVGKIKFSVYPISAFFAWLAGVIYSGYAAAGVPTAGRLYMFDSISAAVIGGVLLSGGKGNILDATLGVIVFSLLYTMIIILGVSPYLEGIFRGLVLLIVVYYGFFRERRE